MKSDKRPKPPTKGARITFRLTGDEKDRLGEIAKAKGLKPGTFVYQRIAPLLRRSA